MIVIQDDFARSTTSRFLDNNYWAFDSTFKTNEHSLPFYTTIVPNHDRIGMPIFLYVIFQWFKQEHEDIALELALTHIFASLGEIQPSAIVIDKYKTSLTIITNVVNKNVYYWNTDGNIRVQIGGEMSLPCDEGIKWKLTW